MSALWPGFLLLLILLPLLIAAYIWMLRRRRRFAVRYSSLSLVRQALPRSNWRRHAPFAIFLLALLSLIIALVRPVAIVSVPTNKTTIILALDVSRSMCSTDIAPNRLTAAKDAAVSFIERQRPGTQIGVVAFSGYAELIQPPTTDAELLEDVDPGPADGEPHGDRQRDHEVDRRHRRDRSGCRAEYRRWLVRRRSRRRSPRGPMRRTSSSC